MNYVKWASSLVFCSTALMHSNTASAAKFQMMKPGEWNMEVLESSLGPMANTIKAKPFCVDAKTTAGNWEEKAKEDMKKSGLECVLKLLKDEANLTAYDMDCKVDPKSEKKNPLIGPNSKFKGQVQLQRVSETEYLMDQKASGTGLNVPKVDLSMLPPEQRKMIEEKMGIKSDGAVNITNKHKYTFASATCTKDAKKAEAKKEDVKAPEPAKKEDVKAPEPAKK